MGRGRPDLHREGRYKLPPMSALSTSHRQNAAFGAGAILASQASQNAGAAFGKHLFPMVGAEGMATLRIGLAAVMLLAILRPWRFPVDRAHAVSLVLYGATMGLMSLLIYLAIARIPIGIAVAIEVTGPLSIVLLGARRPLDFLWLAAAVGGLLLLLPLHATITLDALGVLYAAGAAVCWALYVVFGRRVSGPLGPRAVAWGMLVAALIVAPIGFGHAGTALFAPGILLAGGAVAALSSAVPYSLEMSAMGRLPASVVGILLSTAPAVAALMGFLILGERLAMVQWLAIGCIVAASAGSALTIKPPARTPSEDAAR